MQSATGELSVQSFGLVNLIVTDVGMGGVDESYATVTVGLAVPAKWATTIGAPLLNVRVTWVSPFEAVPHW